MPDADTRTLRILYFAWLRERTRVREETLAVPASLETVDDLVAWLGGRSAGHAAAFANRGTLRCAVNQEFATGDTRLRSGDEVAFFPPVTGG